MKKILISQCLYGEAIVRYDGKPAVLNHDVIAKLNAKNCLILVCPEVEGGLQVPRAPSEIVGERVMSQEGEDVTKAFTTGATRTLQLAKEKDVVCALLKERSPSCGCNYIYDGSFTGTLKSGMGCTASLLKSNGITLFSEEQMEEFVAFLENATHNM